MNFQLLLCISCSRRFRSVPSETPSCNTLYHTLLPFAQWQIFLVSSLKSLSRNHWILIEELHCRRNCLAAWKWSTSNSPFTWSLKTVPASRYQAAGPWGLAQTWKKTWGHGHTVLNGGNGMICEVMDWIIPHSLSLFSTSHHPSSIIPSEKTWGDSQSMVSSTELEAWSTAGAETWPSRCIWTKRWLAWSKEVGDWDEINTLSGDFRWWRQLN